ncbi:MAG: DUF3068 domain-containing protein [Gordonia sp. (in: high G+C Gram-positive bacteria)]|uniref:DUF3068 domain-containing protein n=1 Tax=Gordonia sp. (in: high G+C Gram-positive bacteria) TaxID=84139 RepID=UPI0039E45940
MRRFWLALLAFLGLAGITAAVAIPVYLVPKLEVVPLDLDITSDASTVPADGQDGGDQFPAVIFDRCSISKPKAATLQAHLTQQRRSVIVQPSNAKQATLQSAQMVKIDKVRDADGKESEPTLGSVDDKKSCSDAMLTATIDRVSVDRKTSVPNGVVSSLQLSSVPDGGDVKSASVPIEGRKGFQYKFGFNVQKREYYYYDLNTRQDTVAKFVDEKTIDGVKTYHFETEVPETDISDLPDPDGNAPLGTILNMPAKWWGIKAKGVKPTDMLEMHRFASSVRHVYVEPKTGTIVSGREDQHQFFKSVDDTAPAAVKDFRIDALKGTFQWDDKTVAAQAKRAKHYDTLLTLGGLWLPLVLGVLGGLATLLAVIGLLRKPKPGPDDEPAPDDHDADSVLDHVDADAATTVAAVPDYRNDLPGAAPAVDVSAAAPTTAFPSTDYQAPPDYQAAAHDYQAYAPAEAHPSPATEYPTQVHPVAPAAPQPTAPAQQIPPQQVPVPPPVPDLPEGFRHFDELPGQQPAADDDHHGRHER